MSLEDTQLAAPSPWQRPLGWLIAATEVLALSSVDLQRYLHEEQMSNPALEVEERPICPSCGRALQDQRCPYCQLSAFPAEVDTSDAPLIDEDALWPPDTSGRQVDEGVDPLTLLPARVDLSAHLEMQMRLHLPAQDAPLIEYLVGSLDEEGYLGCTIEEVAQLLEAPVKRVEAVLGVLQAQEPAGIGARSMQECLLLQLHRFEGADASEGVAAQIIAHQWILLGRGHYREIARQLGRPRQQVEAAIAFIQERLTPFPLRGYLGPDLQAGAQPTRTITPDVIISPRAAAEGGYEVDVVEAERFDLTINSAYLQAARALRGSQDESAQHVQEYLERTRILISAIKHRWATLDTLTRCLIEGQPDFLSEGRALLRSVTRAEVAERLGIHPSRVSRATADKYLLLPNAEVVPFSLFFRSDIPIKEVLKELWSQETCPLSDQQVAKVLQARGIPLARRTVAKYREELGILPARLR